MLDVGKLDKSVPIPLYFQLKQILLEAIQRGDYPVDSMIPTEKALAETFRISRTTVRQAVTELVQEGWLYRVTSKGTFVARRKIMQDFIKRLETFDDQILRTGRKPGTELLLMESGEMPAAVQRHFEIAPAGAFIHLLRRRFADDAPIVTVETWLPLPACAFVERHDLSRESMYNVLSLDDAVRICRVTRVLEAVEADESDAARLNLAPGKPVLMSTTVGYNRADEPIEYSIARYRGDRNRFEVDLLIDTSSPKPITPQEATP